MRCEPFDETRVQLNYIHTLQKTLHDLVDGPFPVLRCVGFVFAEMDFCLQHCVHVRNDGSLFAGMYLCWQQLVYTCRSGFMSAAGKQGWCGVCVNAKIASVKYDCV